MADDFFKNIGKTFRETMGNVGKKTDEFVEIQKIRSRQAQMQSRIENNYLEIGRKIYCRFRNGEAFDEQIAPLCQEIISMEKEISICKEQVAERKGQVICPSCGASIQKQAAFCMYCGAALPERKEEKAEDAEFTEVPEDAFEPEDDIFEYEDGERAAEDCSEKGPEEETEEVVKNVEEEISEAVVDETQESAEVGEKAEE